MLVYVTAGPNGTAFRCRFFSRTNVERLCAACAMFGCLILPFDTTGVMAPPVLAPAGGNGVVAPELFCDASTEASLRWLSEIICLTFLLRRCEGFQFGLGMRSR